MKNQKMRKWAGILAAVMLSGTLLSGCAGENGNTTELTETEAAQDTGAETETGAEDGADMEETSAGAEGSTDMPEADTADEQAEATELVVQFGDAGEPFVMQLEDNETAAAIAGYVGSSQWRLPIYERDDDADYDVLQYYDIPSRYDIPAGEPQTVTSARAGEVYYSDPNRIVLYYHDADGISEEYTRIGTFDPTEEFVSAVEENPVLEGWGNKIVIISEP